MIRRLTITDAKALNLFLDRNFRADVLSGGTDAPPEEALKAQVAIAPTWVYDDAGIVGVLGPAMFGERLVDGVKRAFVWFNRLVVDYAIYGTSRDQALQIARDLTLAAADDILAERPVDDILVVGPTDSRGASFCRLLKFTETLNGNESHFECPFKEIWDRAKVARLP